MPKTIELSQNQQRELVAALETLDYGVRMFSLFAAAGRITEDTISALKAALIIPLATLETTDEEYHEMYEKARATIESARAAVTA